MARIDIGDGRIIDEGALVPPSVPKAITRPKPKKPRSSAKAKPKKTKVRYKQTLYNKREPVTRQPSTSVKKRGAHLIAERHAEIPGYRDWVNLRISQMAQFRNKLGFGDWRRTDVPEGMDKAKCARLWAAATKKAKQDMSNLEKAGLLPDDDIAREALQETLEIMRAKGAVNADLRLKAAGQLLTYCKAKPVQRTETKIDAAEAWLAAIAQGDATSED